MAVTAALVAQHNNRLRYLLTSDASGGSVTIAAAGGASPDLQTDSLAGPIKQISLVQSTGLGSVAAGAITQAQARAFLLSDGSTSVGGPDTPRAICQLFPRAGAATWLLDATQTAGNPSVVATASAAVGTAYLDIEVPGAIGA